MFPIPFNFPFRKKDGSITTIDAAIAGGGTPYTLPTASANTKGGVKIGSGLEMSGETLNNTNPTPYALPTASESVKGGVKVGDGLSIDENGVLSASGGGGGIGYIDVNARVQVSANSSNMTNYQIPADSPLIGKTIVAVTCSNNTVNVCGLDAIPDHYPMRANDWVAVFFYNPTISVATTESYRIWYA